MTVQLPSAVTKSLQYSPRARSKKFPTSPSMPVGQMTGQRVSAWVLHHSIFEQTRTRQTVHSFLVSAQNSDLRGLGSMRMTFRYRAAGRPDTVHILQEKLGNTWWMEGRLCMIPVPQNLGQVHVHRVVILVAHLIKRQLQVTYRTCDRTNH